MWLQEQEQMQCYNQRMIEIIKARQQQEKNRLPKIQRSEAKTRMAMFKKSLRINSTGNSSEDREKIKQVDLDLDLAGYLRPCSSLLHRSPDDVFVSVSSLSRRTSGRRPRGSTSSTSMRTR